MEGYKELIKHFSDKKIIVGTTYNDDGWLVTNLWYLESLKDKPLQWGMEYSDCFGRHNAYTIHDPNQNNTNVTYLYRGLGIDNIDTWILKQYITKDTYTEIKETLKKIGTGEDDGDGGLSFADNYSTIMIHNGEYLWYLIAADYLTDDNVGDYLTDDNAGDYLTIEQIEFADDVSEQTKLSAIQNWWQKNKIKEQKFDDIVFGDQCSDTWRDLFKKNNFIK